MIKFFQKIVLSHVIALSLKGKEFHCVKNVRSRSFSDPYFSPFRMKTQRYKIILGRIFCDFW